MRRPSQRSHFEHWFWRGLTALAFAVTLAMCLLPPPLAAQPLAAAPTVAAPR